MNIQLKEQLSEWTRVKFSFLNHQGLGMRYLFRSITESFHIQGNHLISFHQGNKNCWKVH